MNIFSNLIEEYSLFKKKIKNNIKFTNNYVFYDGPPFANGIPHRGHLLTGFIKHFFATYNQNMGNNVFAKIGWDCHGLPMELEIVNKFNITNKFEIQKLGVNNFNYFCKKIILKYIKIWKKYIHRYGKYINFFYKTMDMYYMESVLWAFKEFYDRKMIFLCNKIMPYSWACETPVSDFETHIDNSYRKKISLSITIKIKIILDVRVNKIFGNNYKKLYILFWTTTPWTITCNMALSMSNSIYPTRIKNGNILIGSNKKSIIFCIIEGRLIKDCTYIPIFNYFKNIDNAFIITISDFISSREGTGVVHISPEFGNDDKKICDKNCIRTLCSTNDEGRFIYPSVHFIGMNIFKTESKVIYMLMKRKIIHKIKQHIHNYPHCWRTNTPLIYKIIRSWNFNIVKIKKNIIYNNQKITWFPKHIKNGLFGTWIKNAKNWVISRNRFWGCPLPIWQSNNAKYPYIKVCGSLREIDKTFNINVRKIYRPHIDCAYIRNPVDNTGLSKLIRVKEVLDCWFESGAMFFAQVSYPLRNNVNIRNIFPADFVSEYIAQTRGWFYTLLVLSAAIFKQPPFINILCHGVIVDKNNQKISKKNINNSLMPWIKQNSIDNLRLYFFRSEIMKGEKICINKKPNNSLIKYFINMVQFFCIYSQEGIKTLDYLYSNNVLDRYILSKTSLYFNFTNLCFINYNIFDALLCIESMCDVSVNYYIRHSKVRFWSCYSNNRVKLTACGILLIVISKIGHYISLLSPMILPYLIKLKYPNIYFLIKNLGINIYNLRTLQVIQGIKYLSKYVSKIRDLEYIKIKQFFSISIYYNVLRTSNKIKHQILNINNIKKILCYNIFFKKIVNFEDYDVIYFLMKSMYSNKFLTYSVNILLSLNVKIAFDILGERLSKKIVRVIQYLRKINMYDISDTIRVLLYSRCFLLCYVMKNWKDSIEHETLSSVTMCKCMLVYNVKLKIKSKDILVGISLE